MLINVFKHWPSLEWPYNPFKNIRTDCVLDVPFPQDIEAFCEHVASRYKTNEVSFAVDSLEEKAFLLVRMLEQKGFEVVHRHPSIETAEQFIYRIGSRRREAKKPPYEGCCCVHFFLKTKSVYARIPSGSLCILPPLESDSKIAYKSGCESDYEEDYEEDYEDDCEDDVESAVTSVAFAGLLDDEFDLIFVLVFDTGRVIHIRDTGYYHIKQESHISADAAFQKVFSRYKDILWT